MTAHDDTPISRLIRRARDGDEKAHGAIVEAAYDELKDVAHRQIARLPSGGTLNTTAVVHEAFLKLNGSSAAAYADRIHFFAVAARAMRQILIDYVRQQHALKRGGKDVQISLDDVQLADLGRSEQLLDLGEALERLAEISPRLTRVVEFRFFAGLTEKETAEVLSVTERTVRRDWVKAKAWLHRELTER